MPLVADLSSFSMVVENKEFHFAMAYDIDIRPAVILKALFNDRITAIILCGTTSTHSVPSAQCWDLDKNLDTSAALSCFNLPLPIPWASMQPYRPNTG